MNEVWMGKGEVSPSCFLPTGSKPFIQSKIEQSKHKQKYQDSINPGTSAFVFRFFTPSPLCPLPSVRSLFSKKRKGKIGKKSWKGKHQKTTYLQGKFKSKTITTKTQPVSVFTLLWSQLKQWANAKPEKGAENKAEKIKSENLRMKKIPKISWKGKGCFRWDKRTGFDCTWTLPVSFPPTSHSLSSRK